MSHDPNRPTDMNITSETVVEKPGNGGMIWFIVGGLVVAVAVIFYFMNGGDVPTTDGGGDVSVTVEGDNNAAPADSAAEGSAEGGAGRVGKLVEI